MSLGTYGGIKLDILRELDRLDDAAIGERWGALTEAAEERIWNGADHPYKTEALRTTNMETAIDLPVTSGSALLPNDCLEVRRLFWDADPSFPVHYRTPNEFWTANYEVTHQPLIYTQEGSSLKFAPAMSGTVKILYYARPDALQNDADTNWLMVSAPSVYREAIMFEVARFLRESELQQQAFASFKSAIGGLMSSNYAARTSGRPLYPRIRRAAV